ncbi:NAD(P)/FAD-dependent oxidoreductase [Nocardioides daejeonensis]|uniref:NAD(P)/FAD-dependent oxidoreductase n=1 Tax=Nocardioides daejeonensis TaxID=1046556 RepID=UPI000D744825|nr:FAD-dependent oxidoreductase [Nocardioides daejeonensis]
MTERIEQIVIVGAGLAGTHAAEELRAAGYTGRLMLIGAELHLPYDRPPLSKGVLLGKDTAASIQLHPQEWYDEQRIELRTGEAVTALDLAARRVSIGSWTIGYHRLLLATGSRPRHLEIVDDSGSPVHHVRSLDDAEGLRGHLKERLLIVGGGWIGLEVAAAARAAGGEVTLIEATGLPLAGVLGGEVAPVFADLHRAHGVDLRTGVTLADVRAGAGGTRAVLTDGSTVDVDRIVVGVGAVPETHVAREAGLVCQNGILVDAALQTSDPFVYAAGDVANQAHPQLGRLRVEHWDNAIAQGRHTARAMLGEHGSFEQQPYFFSDQYDLGMEYVGHVGPHGYDRVQIEGSLAERVFTAFWLRGDQVVAGMHAGDWGAIDRIRDLVGGPAERLAVR